MTASPVEDDLLVAGRATALLLGEVAVVEGWDRPSALPEMSVGALAAHLASQVLTVHAALSRGEAVTDERPVTLAEHYQRVPWARSGLDDESNVSIREGAQRAAGPGHDAIVTAVDDAMRDLRQAFGSGMARPPAIRMPWWGWALSFEDFLLTRVMEMVVHGDDLAVSVDVAPPELPHDLLGPVLALLLDLSLRRHGQAAVVRALSRSERGGAISAF